MAPKAGLALLCCFLALNVSNALAARKLATQAGPTSTNEASVYLEAVESLGTTTVASAEACMAACIDNAACKVWAYCPATSANGCSVTYGDLSAEDKVVPAGGCQLSGDSSDSSYSIFGARGPAIPFSSGAVRRPDTVPAASPAAGPGGAPTSAPAPAGPLGGALYCAELPEAQRTCGELAYASLQAANPGAWLDAYKAAAVDKFNADQSNNWRGYDCTPLPGVRVACQNTGSPGAWTLVFDADCGADGTTTLQAQGSMSPVGTVDYFGLVNALCQAELAA